MGYNGYARPRKRAWTKVWKINNITVVSVGRVFNVYGMLIN